MADLDDWASVIARLLKPNGKLLLFEGHPLDFLWREDAESFELRDSATYFQPVASPEFGFPYGAAKRFDPTKDVALTSRVWTLGETVNAVIRAGIRVTCLEEFPDPFWDQFKYIDGDAFARLPHTFALVAGKASNRPTS